MEPYFLASTDFVDSVNEYCIMNGMSKDYFVFHDGSFLSAIRLSDQKIVSLDRAWQVTGVFQDLDAWYPHKLGHNYADVYGFPLN